MSTSKSCWKGAETRVARFFDSRRTPLSGSNSGHTFSDTLSKTFFVETKLRGKMFAFSLHQKAAEYAKKEGKIPVLALLQKHGRGFLVCVQAEDCETFCRAYLDMLKNKRELERNLTGSPPKLRLKLKERT